MAENNAASASTVAVPSRSYGKTIRKHCLIVGRTGSGKSSIINMVMNNGCSESDCTGPNAVSHDASSGTPKAKFSIVPGRKWLICDTIGFGDLDRSSERLIADLRAIYKSARMGVNRIVLVVRGPRWDREDFAYIEVLEKVFGKNWIDNAILVVTHYHAGFKTGESAWKQWCGERSDVEEVVKRFNSVIFTDNDWRRTDEESRKNMRLFLGEFMSSVEASDKIIAIKPITVEQIFQFIVMQLEKMFGIDPRPLLETYKRSVALLAKDEDYFCSCGECAICTEEISIKEMVATPCAHQFHRTCWNDWSSKNPTCHFCTKDVSKVYDAYLRQ
eukprot:scpid74507/ scgid11050/ 